MAKLVNRADAIGMLDSVEIGDTSLFTVYTSAIYIEKKADRTVWADGDLTYTILISNVDDIEPARPIEDAVFTDVIDPTIAVLQDNSVMNGTTPLTPSSTPDTPALGEYVYDPDTGLLTIPLGDVFKGTDIELSFRVDKTA